MSDVIRVAVRGLQFSADKVAKEIRDGTRDELKRMGAYIRGIARRSIGKGKVDSKGNRVYSEPGRPPKTWTGALKNSIAFGVEEDSVVIGPGYGRFGRLGSTHEFGGTESVKRKTTDYLGRPITVPGTNWRIGPQGHGPIDGERGSFRYGKLWTMAQVRRSQRIVQEFLEWERGWGIKPMSTQRRYPARPFMAPVLRKIAGDLPIMLRGSVNNG
jgi:phage gpG-like protein